MDNTSNQTGDNAKQGSATAKFGMALGIIPFAIFFAATLVFYIIMRIKVAADPAMPSWPLGKLLISTLILLAVSVTMHLAVSAVKSGKFSQAKGMVASALVLSLVFLFSQVWVWGSVIPDWDVDAPSHYVFSFFLLTVLHAAHVIGGIIPLVTVTIATWRGYYRPDKTVGLRSLAVYWHFLDAVWLIMFFTFLVTN